MSTSEQRSGETTQMGGNVREMMRSKVERIERLNAEKDAILADTKQVYDEAKAFGLDTKILRKVVTMRKKDPADLSEERAVLDLYLDALGMDL